MANEESYPSVDDLVHEASNVFRSVFKQDPTHCGSAPGRVNLIGEHVDYCDGLVLPMAVPMYTVVVGARTEGPSCQVVTTGLPGGHSLVSFPLPGGEEQLLPGEPQWSNYVRGVVANFPGPLLSFRAAVVSSVPIGAGLSSSAALEMATFFFLEALLDKPLEISSSERALCCQRAEHQFAGVPCGVMDQFISCLGRKGHVLLLDCRSLESELVPLNSSSLVVLVTDSNVKHELSSSEYAKRRASCHAVARILGKSLRDTSLDDLQARKEELTPEQLQRATHVVTEISRTAEAARSLVSSSWATFGRLMTESHHSLRDNFEVSCPELDTLVSLAVSQEGVYGSRMTGGGFGGCTVTLVEKMALPMLLQHLQSHYKGTATFYVCQPSDGASGKRITRETSLMVQGSPQFPVLPES